ncbi:MAG: (d)CMP kinase [Actinomycetota bacterium]|nr:(d)CMP kinase [Actinomycetota bacterium]
MVIAIDGPSGVGKTTVSRLVGESLGWPALDTGALYRAFTLAVLRAGIDPNDQSAVVELVPKVRVEFDGDRTYLDGEDVSRSIRSAEVTGAVSAVSALPAVRRHLVGVQRRWVAERGGSAVVEGRDIGTVVFPAAPVKVFLTARPHTRATRRARDEGSRDVGGVATDLGRRDRADSSRSAAPLRAAEDAVVIDTSELSAGQVARRVLELVQQAM